MGPAIGRRLAAEVVGTSILVGIGASAGAASGGSFGVVPVAFAHGLGLMVAIYAFGPTSGGHFNPTVTLALVARRRFPPAEMAPYILAQLLGGVIGAAVVLAVLGDAGVDVGLGATTLAEDIGPLQGMVAEAVGTFVLLTAVMALAVDVRAPAGFFGLGIGLGLAGIIMAFGPVSGASLNLARTLGPNVMLSLAGGDAAWGDFFVYLIGPLVGGLLAVIVHDVIAQAPTVADTDVVELQGPDRDVAGGAPVERRP